MSDQETKDVPAAEVAAEENADATSKQGSEGNNNNSKNASAIQSKQVSEAGSKKENGVSDGEKNASGAEGSEHVEGEGAKSCEENAEGKNPDAEGEGAPDKSNGDGEEGRESGEENAAGNGTGEEGSFGEDTPDYPEKGGEPEERNESKNSEAALRRELGSTVFKQETYLMYEVTDKHSFAEYQLSDFADAFKMYDVMGDSMLSSEQLYKALQWIGEAPDPDDYQKALDKVDLEGKDAMNFQGMLDILGQFSREPITELELLETFELMDQDKSGTIDAGELKRLMTCVGHALTMEESEHMIDEADADYSGEVDFDEFSHTILSSQY